MLELAFMSLVLVCLSFPRLLLYLKLIPWTSNNLPSLWKSLRASPACHPAPSKPVERRSASSHHPTHLDSHCPSLKAFFTPTPSELSIQLNLPSPVFPLLLTPFSWQLDLSCHAPVTLPAQFPLLVHNHVTRFLTPSHCYILCGCFLLLPSVNLC